jgi:hypothetical protein
MALNPVEQGAAKTSFGLTRSHLGEELGFVHEKVI